MAVLAFKELSMQIMKRQKLCFTFLYKVLDSAV